MNATTMRLAGHQPTRCTHQFAALHSALNMAKRSAMQFGFGRSERCKSFYFNALQIGGGAAAALP
jgi:hypothetical protein